jgi:hypothetical protein
VTAVLQTVNVARFAVLSGAYDYFAIFSLKSWVFGWMCG